MTQQLTFIKTPRGEQAAHFPEGMRYQSELIDPVAETGLVAKIRELPFKHFEFHGHQGKRRTVSFGWRYEFSGAGRLQKADDIPEFLLPLRARAAAFADLPAESLEHVLVIEYGPGAGIGWHRDRPVFGKVIGVSLLASCVLRFRRKIIRPVDTASDSDEIRSKWDRVNLIAEPRSAYHLRGRARHEWEHSILRVNELRYSITFRTMHRD